MYSIDSHSTLCSSLWIAATLSLKDLRKVSYIWSLRNVFFQQLRSELQGLLTLPVTRDYIILLVLMR